jgi:restriction endonuclease S subunit
MASISKKVLDELEISVPDLLTQEKILKINRLRETEKRLKIQMESLREKQIQQMILNALK